MAKVDQFSDEEFSQFVQKSLSYADVLKKCGYLTKSSSTYSKIKERIEKLQLSTDHFVLSKKSEDKVQRTPENIFIKGSTAHQKTLRKYFINGEYVPYKCSICGQLPIWNDKPLTLILDHINGINNDDRLENLRWVCPNCNQQLPTTGSKNIINLRNKKAPSTSG